MCVCVCVCMCLSLTSTFVASRDSLSMKRLVSFAFSALTLLDGWQEGHPSCKKTEWWDAGMVISLGLGADLHAAQLMPLPLTVSCTSKSRLVLPGRFYFSGTGSPGIPGQTAIKWV